MNPYRILDISKTQSLGAIEPVTLAEAKKWLKVTFTDDDDVITALITSSRQAVEEFCCISIISQQIICDVILDRANNRSLYVEFELPYGPILPSSNIESVRADFPNEFNTINNGSDYWFLGDTFYKFFALLSGQYRFIYAAGMASIPAALKEAIKIEVTNRYENRGDESEGPETLLCDRAKQIAKPYKRMAWL